MGRQKGNQGSGDLLQISKFLLELGFRAQFLGRREQQESIEEVQEQKAAASKHFTETGLSMRELSRHSVTGSEVECGAVAQGCG